MPNTPNPVPTVVSPGDQTPDVRLNNTVALSNAAHQVTPEPTPEPDTRDRARVIIDRAIPRVARRLFF